MALSSALLRELERLGPVRRNEPMARHTTMQVGGPADLYFSAHNCQALARAVQLATAEGLRFFLMGGGSNLLVADGGLRGLVIATWSNADPLAHHPPMRDPAEPGAMLLQAFCGAPLPRLAHSTAQAGFTGLEWAAGVPGTVGGGIVNNAGAHGGDMAGVVAEALVLVDGAQQRVPASELDLSYRQSRFRGAWEGRCPPVVLLEATLRLWPAPPANAQRRVQECLDYRRRTQPAQRSVGSIFKNPPGDAAGRLIEQAGLKGTRIGGAEVSPVHANFIVNRGDATARDVNALIALVQRRVRDCCGVHLELEIQRVGDHDG